MSLIRNRINRLIGALEEVALPAPLGLVNLPAPAVPQSGVGRADVLKSRLANEHCVWLGGPRVVLHLFQTRCLVRFRHRYVRELEPYEIRLGVTVVFGLEANAGPRRKLGHHNIRMPEIIPLEQQWLARILRQGIGKAIAKIQLRGMMPFAKS